MPAEASSRFRSATSASETAAVALCRRARAARRHAREGASRGSSRSRRRSSSCAIRSRPWSRACARSAAQYAGSELKITACERASLTPVRDPAGGSPPPMSRTRGRCSRNMRRGSHVDLCFQGFARGARDAARARTRLRVAGCCSRDRSEAAMGCIALRPLADDVVGRRRGQAPVRASPAPRGTGLGEALVETLLHEARAIGYRELKLDTLDRMTRRAPAVRAGWASRRVRRTITTRCRASCT